MNSVFHPSRKNPFQDPPLPQSHYAPSPNKEILDKSVTLTPQKLKHRHEYSFPPEVYTPEQYSIHEEKSPFNKSPLPTHGNNDVVLNLQQILSDVETWDSMKFCEKWSSRISEVEEDAPSRKLAFDKPLIQRPLSSTIKSAASKPPVKKMKEKPIRIQTSFASDQNSTTDHDRTTNIQQRLDRFRFGVPKAPDKRKAEKSMQSTSSGVSANRSQSLRKSPSNSSKQTRISLRSPIKDSNTTRVRHHENISMPESTKEPVQDRDYLPKPPVPPLSESADLIDTSLSSLNSRLDRLIQQSSSVAISPLSTLKSTVDRSTTSILKVSSDSTTLSSDFAVIAKPPESTDHEIPRRMMWQKDNSLPVGVKKSAGSPKKNDILYQWRLNRKLEEAREHVESSKGMSCNGLKSPGKTERPFSAEASRVLQDSTSVSGIRSNPVTPKKRNVTFFHPPSQQHFPLSSHHLSDIEPMKFYQASGGCPCVHQLPHFMGPEPVPATRDAAVGVTKMVSIETQTGRSLVFSDDPYNDSPAASEQDGVLHESRTKSTCVNTFPHTSTPASTVSFHRVKIVEAEPDNSPQPTKDSCQAKNATKCGALRDHSIFFVDGPARDKTHSAMPTVEPDKQAQSVSPVSCKTEATTLWSSTDQKRMEGSQSPVSSVPSSHQRHAIDADPCSPTADVVKQVVGSHLFNTTRSSSTTSAVSRLKNKKQLRIEETKHTSGEENCLDGSYMKSSHSEKSFKNISASSVNSSQGGETPVKSTTPQHCSNPDNPVPDGQSGQNVAKTPPLSQKKPLSPVEEIQRAEEVDETASESSFENYESDFDPVDFFERILEDNENQYGLIDEKILKELRRQKNHILEEFRLIADEIEMCESSNL